eukprot:gene10447-7426_t
MSNGPFSPESGFRPSPIDTNRITAISRHPNDAIEHILETNDLSPESSTLIDVSEVNNPMRTYLATLASQMATKLREKLVQLKELAGLLMNSRQEFVLTQSAVYQALMGFQQFQADQWETSVNDLIASNEKLSQRCMEQQLVI